MSNKKKAIEEEVCTAYSLIREGLIVLLKMEEDNNHFHLPLFIISNGLERLLKSIILIDYYNLYKSYPNDKRYFKKISTDSLITGHELDFLFEKVFDIYNKSDLLKHNSDSAVDYKFIQEDLLPQRMISFLSEFAIESRYRNLNVLLGSDNGKYESPELTFHQLLKQVENLKFKDLSNEKYKIFDLCIREVFISIVKITRYLSNYFSYGGYGLEGMRHINEAWTFLKYSDGPKLDLKKYER